MLDSAKSIHYVKPHPCGYLTDKSHECSCSPMQISRYQKKISGPLLDRIDIHLEVPAVEVNKLTDEDISSNETSETIRNRVQNARDIQTKRFQHTPISSNSEISSKMMKEFCVLSPECMELLKKAITTFKLSGRSYHRIIKLARTIADLEAVEVIAPSHIAEALQFRPRYETI